LIGIDYIFLLMFAVPLVYGLFRGIVRMVISVIAVYTGFVFARQYSMAFSEMLEAWTRASGKYVETVAFIVCFLGVAILISLFGRIVRKGIHGANLGFIDRILGGMVGGALGLMLSFGLIFLIFTYLPGPDQYLRGSRLAPRIASTGTYLLLLVPPWLEEGVQEEFDRLKRLLRKENEENSALLLT
jgi:membrane protein required for colicin V production